MLEDWQGELAIAKRELIAHTDEGISAEAAERVKLAAVVDSNYAEAQHELAVLATKQSVEATRTDSLLVRMGDAESAILEEAQTRADADSAMASQTRTMVASLSGDAGDALVGDVLGRAEGTDIVFRQYAAIQETMDVVVKENEEAVARIETTLGAAIGENYAAIKNEMETRATQDEALARVQQNLTAVVGQNTAAIQEESLARTTADSAMASQITTLESVVNNPSTGLEATRAALQTEATTRATADSALTSSVQTLQTTVNGHTSSISTINQSVNGIKSKHAVKIDTNGYVTGYELIGTGSSGSMVFLVDNFIVGRPGAWSACPFVIGTVDGVTKVSMSNAFIQDAAISSAKIKNLEVGRIKLKNGGEISAINSTYATSSLYKTTGSYMILSATVRHDANATARTIVIASVSIQNHLAQAQAWITQNGVDKACIIDTGWADEGDVWSHTLAWTDTTNTGTFCSYGLRVKVINGGACTIRPRSLSVIHIYK